MIKSINIMLNNYCNNKCRMCNIWKSETKETLTLDDIKTLFSHKEFSTVKEVSLSGGEVALVKELKEILTYLCEQIPSIERIFLNTNGLLGHPTKNIVDDYKESYPNLYVSVSLEGDRETHNHIRGVPSYDNCIDLIDYVGTRQRENIKLSISTTIQDSNASISQIRFLEGLAKDKQALFTFRFADTSNTYYGNEAFSENNQSKEDKISFVREAIKTNDSLFLKDLLIVLEQDIYPVMCDKQGNLVCRAGELFCFIHSSKNIYSCMYSEKIIGTINEGIIQKDYDPSVENICPCFTECHYYPMKDFGDNN